MSWENCDILLLWWCHQEFCFYLRLRLVRVKAFPHFGVNIFFSFWGEHFGGVKEKIYGFITFFSSPSPNQTPIKKFSLHFSFLNFSSSLKSLQTVIPLKHYSPPYHIHSHVTKTGFQLKKKIINKIKTLRAHMHVACASFQLLVLTQKIIL